MRRLFPLLLLAGCLKAPGRPDTGHDSARPDTGSHIDTSDTSNPDDTSASCPDNDSDGWGRGSEEDLGACEHPEPDCDDQDPSIHPHALELLDGQDDNCDGYSDVQFLDSGDFYLFGAEQNSGFGTSATSLFGNEDAYLAVGAPSAGKGGEILLYRDLDPKPGSTPVEPIRIVGNPGDSLGRVLASAKGEGVSFLAAAAANDIYVFGTKNFIDTAEPGKTLEVSDAFAHYASPEPGNDEIGCTLAFAKDSTALLVGAPKASSNAGRVYLLENVGDAKISGNIENVAACLEGAEGSKLGSSGALLPFNEDYLLLLGATGDSTYHSDTDQSAGTLYPLLGSSLNVKEGCVSITAKASAYWRSDVKNLLAGSAIRTYTLEQEQDGNSLDFFVVSSRVWDTNGESTDPLVYLLDAQTVYDKLEDGGLTLEDEASAVLYAKTNGFSTEALIAEPVGDLDGDGTDELAVFAPEADLGKVFSNLPVESHSSVAWIVPSWILKEKLLDNGGEKSGPITLNLLGEDEERLPAVLVFPQKDEHLLGFPRLSDLDGDTISELAILDPSFQGGLGAVYVFAGWDLGSAEKPVPGTFLEGLFPHPWRRE